MVVVKIKGEKAPVSNLKFETASVKIHKGNHKFIQLSVLPSYTPLVVNSSDEKILTLSLAGVNTYKLTALKEGRCVIKASASGGKLSALCKVEVLPPGVPSPWKLDDIKDNKASAVYKNGTFSVEGGGADIWGSIDQFAFVNKEASGDNFISARIVSQENTDTWAKAGLMFRDNTEPNSAFVMLCVTPANGISLQWRGAQGEACEKKDFSAVSLPVYFKISKKGSAFSAYKSADGKQWDLLGDVTLNDTFPETVPCRNGSLFA